jgi:Leu/Phe-tRNA-protein transferase
MRVRTGSLLGAGMRKLIEVQMVCVLAGLIVFGSSSAFAAGSCDLLFKSTVVAESPRDQAESLFARAADGISDRGFIASKPALTTPLSEAAGQKGLMWWGLRIYVAESVAAAKKHSELEPDPLMQGVYLIDPAKAPGGNTKLVDRPAPEVFRELLQSESMYYVKNGEAQKIDPAFVQKNFTVDEVTWNVSEASGRGPFLYQTGWAFPKSRGVILQAETLGSSTYKKTRALANRLIADGFTVTFNRDFKQSLDYVRDQKRKVGEEWVANSRYQDADIYQTALESFQAGRAFSIEVWNEKGRLVGGLIGNREGSIFSPDSVFYDQVNYPQISIGFSKIAVVAMMDRVSAAGIPFVDAGMVSPFTASMKGRLVPSEQFLNLIKELPPEAAVAAKLDFTSSWRP